VNYTVADPAAVMATLKALPGVTVQELDGVTVRAKDWWCNLRASNTEPVVRLNLEADTAALMKAKLDEIGALIKA
jgi:phosphomannomutase